MSDSLKEKSRSALFWNFIDKGGQQAIQLGFVMLLARLLDVADFGLVALLAIFTVIANLLQESGFSAALIRDKNPTESDYSSVFYFNISVSLFIYAILYLFAPVIASFYDDPRLTNLSRLIFLSFVFNAFGIIQNVHLLRRMDFRSNAKITFVAGLISGAVAVWAAYSGYGVWSLAIQLVLQTFIRNLLLWLVIKWRPSLVFDAVKLKEMMPYSIKLLASSIFNQATAYIYPLIIGKCFSITQVGYYGQANKLNTIPQSIIADSLQGVTYPLLTKLDNEERLRRIFRKIMRIASFICFPVALLTIIAARPIVELLLSEKYLGSAPILQLLAISGAIYPMYVLSGALLKALGKSGLLLKTELIRNILFILSILISFRFGILALITGFVTVYIIAFVITFYLSGKHISYQLKHVFKDILPYAAISVLIFAPLYLLGNIIHNNYLLLATQIIIGGGAYLLVIKLLGSKVMEDCLEFVKGRDR
ncbi:lipopolysaccharide biosynthesis protein [Viscerimonas tarda]